MNLDSFTGPGSTPSRRRFWDKVTQAVNASQKIEGRNVSVDEHQGMGTLINVTRGRGSGPPTPVCPKITFSGVGFCTCLEVTAFSHWYDFGSPETLNDVEYTTGEAFVCSDIYQGCETTLESSPSVHGIAYFATPCSPENIDFEFDVNPIAVLIARIAGIYYILVVSTVFGPPELIFFYGTTTSLAVTASNEVTCNGAGSTWDNALVNCFFGSPQTFIGAASSGIATLSS